MGLYCRGLAHKLRYSILPFSHGETAALSVRLMVICNQNGLCHDLVNYLALVIFDGEYDPAGEISKECDRYKTY
jgi:hypothetical protein